MISVEEAQKLIRETLTPVGTEAVALEDAMGRILAEPVKARLSQPPFRSSAMDGYAVRLADVAEKGVRLPVIGVSSAGARFNGALQPDAAVRIFTGAPVPDEADHVLIQEHAERNGDTIIVTHAQGSAKNIRPLGVDFREGETLLEAGTRLAGPALALAAAGNVATVQVRKRPRVAIIANGDELVMPGGAPGPDEIICSIPFGLAPMIRDWGGAPDFLGAAPDDKRAIRAVVERALDYDLIAPIGGASVGDRDYMHAVFDELGFSPVFNKVAVKPGKPAWFGKLGNAAVLGLPGNPASALVTAILFVKTALTQMLARNDATMQFSARTTTPLKATGPRETYLRARIVIGADGERRIAPFENQDSSLLSVMARADALIRRPANGPAVPEGAPVGCVNV